jgi:hypothetical protein
MTRTGGNSNGRYRFRFGLRSLFATITLLALYFAGYGYLERAIFQPRRQSDAIERRIRSLANRRPNDMSPRQWESAVAWTVNLHVNSLIMFQADGEQIRKLDRRLVKKLAGDVNLDTIHWIWDEYAEICSGGASYQRFRAQMEDEITRGGANWGLNVP